MIGYEVQGRAVVITIRRPQARNAVNAEVAEGMEHALDQLEEDGAVWAGVIAGEGPVFSAGADLRAVAAGQMERLFTARGGFAGITRRERTKPLVAAVDGPALAGGFEIALACDVIVASTAATFGLPEVKRSLVAGAGGLFRLPRALPARVAMEMVLTGDPIGAERGHQLGLFNQLVEEGRALDAGVTLAERICANAPLAVRESRRMVLAAGHGDDERLWRQSAEALARVMETEDCTEGARAFIEKRAAEWSNR